MPAIWYIACANPRSCRSRWDSASRLRNSLPRWANSRMRLSSAAPSWRRFNATPGMRPLPDRDLMRIYERIMDIMRQIQQEEIAPAPAEKEPEPGTTELDSEVND